MKRLIKCERKDDLKIQELISIEQPPSQCRNEVKDCLAFDKQKYLRERCICLENFRKEP